MASYAFQTHKCQMPLALLCMSLSKSFGPLLTNSWWYILRLTHLQLQLHWLSAPPPTSPTSLAFCELLYTPKEVRLCQKFCTLVGICNLNSGISVNSLKVQAILDWLAPTNVHEMRTFHGLASFYWCFIKDFSNIRAPIIECTKNGPFVWSVAAEKAFQAFKQYITKALSLASQLWIAIGSGLWCILHRH